MNRPWQEDLQPSIHVDESLPGSEGWVVSYQGQGMVKGPKDSQSRSYLRSQGSRSSSHSNPTKCNIREQWYHNNVHQEVVTTIHFIKPKTFLFFEKLLGLELRPTGLCQSYAMPAHWATGQ